ncbi:hypothetical protein BMS3Bbin04_00672 [bacterium BMS3Bbin04]|nr:hypothetical protein BMS3Bbin04_00672 [bacterium BMS3Bbin04]
MRRIFHETRKCGFLQLIVIILLTLAFLPHQSFSQWSGDGVRLIDWPVNDGVDCCPGGQGGVWYAQNYGAYQSQMVVVQHIDSEGYHP